MKYIINLICLALLIFSCNTEPKPCNGEHGIYTDNLDTALKYPNCISILNFTIPNRTYKMPSLAFLKQNMMITITDTVGRNNWKQLLCRIAEIDSIRTLSLQGTIRQSTLPLRLNKKNTIKELEIWMPVDTFPKIISKMKDLEYLKIWNISSSQDISNYLTKTPKLNRLEIIKYPSDSLPSSIAGLNKLGYLYIGGNKLKYIPRDIIKIKGLHEVDFTGTPLAKSELSYFKKHKHYNQLKIIEDSLPHCSIVLQLKLGTKNSPL